MIPSTVSLTPGKRVLFLTKDPELIRRSRGRARPADGRPAVADLLDDINTDAMTPAWVCFDHRPEDIARERLRRPHRRRRAAVPDATR